MFCSQCGNKILVDSKFCSECGHPTLQKEDKDDTQEMVIEEQTTITEAVDQEENKVEKKRWWLLALPLSALLLGIVAVSLIFYIETNQNDKATTYISNAQGFALEGKWQEAIESYDKALSFHPMNKTILSEKDMISFALSVEEDIDSIREYLEEKKL